MGKQISFYRNDAIEREIEHECKRLGLTRFDQPSGPFFAITDPGEHWLDANAIQFSSASGNDTHRARLWTGTSDLEFAKIYDKLRRFVRSSSDFDSDSRLWVWKPWKREFAQYWSERQQQLNELVSRNRERAIKELGPVK
jgi:hypothetical protein